MFQTLGHAGLIGTHTALKRSTEEDPHQYAITLNERVQGGLHLTLEHMIKTRCLASPSSIMQALKYEKGDIKKIVKFLKRVNTCSPVYYTLIDQHGQSFVIEKNRGRTVNLIRGSDQIDNVKYLVQTNHDMSKADPDGRSDIATEKVRKTAIQNAEVEAGDLWRILLASPNFNELTLMSSVIDV